MQDRLSTYPGRIKLTPVEGQENVYDVERMDEPSQVGTELKTETLLSDATAASLGLDNSATPNTAFAKIKSLMDTMDSKIIECALGSYTGTGTANSGNARTLSFSFAPKILVLFDGNTSPDVVTVPTNALSTSSYAMVWARTTSYLYMKKSADGKTITWYTTSNGFWNTSNKAYCYAAIG